MSSEYGSDSKRLELPNPHRLLNRLLAVRRPARPGRGREPALGAQRDGRERPGELLMPFARSQSVRVAPVSGGDEQRIAALNPDKRAIESGAPHTASAAQLHRDLQPAAARAAVGMSSVAAPRERVCTACGSGAQAGARFCANGAAPLLQAG
jgi:hypothetical protein